MAKGPLRLFDTDEIPSGFKNFKQLISRPPTMKKQQTVADDF